MGDNGNGPRHSETQEPHQKRNKEDEGDDGAMRDSSFSSGFLDSFLRQHPVDPTAQSQGPRNSAELQQSFSAMLNNFSQSNSGSSPLPASGQGSSSSSTNNMQGMFASILNRQADSRQVTRSSPAPSTVQEHRQQPVNAPSGQQALNDVFMSILSTHSPAPSVPPAAATAAASERTNEGAAHVTAGTSGDEKSSVLQAYFSSVLNAQARTQSTNISDLSPEAFCDLVERDPGLAMQLREHQPFVYEAVLNKDYAVVQGMLDDMKKGEKKREERRREISERLKKNPMDERAQQMMEEDIRNENAIKNREYAFEHHPEAFATVEMLYISCSVNKEPLIAMVDTGAQTSVMSLEFARRCRIDMMMDTHASGMAEGVGTAKIVGKVWSCDICIGGTFYAASFSVVESYHLDFLLGLDFMRRFLCCVDLRSNCLRIGDNAVSFLPSESIPHKQRKQDKGDADKSTSSSSS